MEETRTVEQEYRYTYDGMSQLAAAHLKQTVTTKEGKTEKEESKTAYVYDMAGNRLSMEHTGEGVTEKVTYTYDAAGRMTGQSDESGETTYTYDAAGNLIREAGSETRYYQYDAANRLTAVMNREDLLLAALYDGNDNRVFVMEYDPAEPEGTGDNTDTPGDGNAGTENGSTQTAERGTDPGSRNTGKEPEGSGQEEAALSENKPADTIGQTVLSTGETDHRTESVETTGGEEKNRKPLTAFWYGVLCQAADIILPAPETFKLWLHDRMGFTDDVSVLFETKAAVYETDLSAGGYRVQEAGSPFELINRAVNRTTGRELSADAYRQTGYVNDINTAYTQVLTENVTWGGAKETVAYSYGVYRESYKASGTAEDSRYTPVGMTGSYYYSGTGSVSNLVGSRGSVAYAYKPDGETAAYSAEGVNETVNGYTYRGEYTHGSLGIQYLRARYLKVETGTFTSRDTYAGRIANILSQNRYTYAENNPVNFADPSGHRKYGNTPHFTNRGNFNRNKNPLPSLQDNINTLNGGGSGNKRPTLHAGEAAVGNGHRGTKDPQRTFLENIHIANRGDTVNGVDYYSHVVENASISALTGPLGGMTFAESVAAKIEAARCIAYQRIENEKQNDIYQNQIITFNEKLYEENKYYRTTADYIKQIENDKLSDKQIEELEEIRRIYLKNKDRYEKISEENGYIPPEVIAAIHYRENATDFLEERFSVYLHKGDSLGELSNNVPKPDLYMKNEFNEAALDALRGYDEVNNNNYLENRAISLNLTSDSRDLTAMVTFTSFYQGWQYGVSNYIYSGTSIYQSGVYVADHVYDEDKKDENLGTYLVLKTLLE